MKKKLTGILIIVGVVALMFFGAFTIPGNAHALLITRTPIAPLQGDATKAALSNFYQREQNWLGLQVTHLQKANQVSTTAQQLIDAAKAEGQDTSSLEAALAEFNGHIADAQNAHNAAASTLGAHNGFDGSGNVTDLQAAHQTVVDARLSLRSAHTEIAQAVIALDQAIANWRRTH